MNSWGRGQEGRGEEEREGRERGGGRGERESRGEQQGQLKHSIPHQSSTAGWYHSEGGRKGREVTNSNIAWIEWARVFLHVSAQICLLREDSMRCGM